MVFTVKSPTGIGMAASKMMLDSACKSIASKIDIRSMIGKFGSLVKGWVLHVPLMLAAGWCAMCQGSGGPLIFSGFVLDVQTLIVLPLAVGAGPFRKNGVWQFSRSSLTL